MRRVRLVMPLAQAEGTVDASSLDCRLSRLRLDRALQDEGSVPVRLLLSSSSHVRLCSWLYASGRLPVKPTAFRYRLLSEVTYASAEGRDEVAAIRPPRLRPITVLPLHVTPSHDPGQGVPVQVDCRALGLPISE
jgi:hypothetical protein